MLTSIFRSIGITSLLLMWCCAAEAGVISLGGIDVSKVNGDTGLRDALIAEYQSSRDHVREGDSVDSSDSMSASLTGQDGPIILVALCIRSVDGDSVLPFAPLPRCSRIFFPEGIPSSLLKVPIRAKRWC